MFRLFLIIVVFLLSFTPLIAQSAVKKIHVDNLGNVYIIHNEQLLKFNAEGTLTHSFSNKKAGNISSVDVSDPMQVLVFYENAAQILFLDNTLSETNLFISLINSQMLNPSLVCVSPDKGMWMYDKPTFSIIKTDRNLNIQHATRDIFTLADSDFDPSYMTVNNTFLYLTAPGSGIFVFDKLGTFHRKMHFPDVKHFDVLDNALYYISSNTLVRIDLTDYISSWMDLSMYKYSDAVYSNKCVYFLNEDGKTFTKIEVAFEKK